MCPACGSLRHDWARASGRARLVSWVVVHPPVLPAWKDRVPYPVVLVECEEGVRTIGGLAGAGADVLRIDPPSPPEIGWQHLDTGPGKRSAILDLRSAEDAARFGALLASADAIVLGYRPSALRRLGLEPDALIESHPGLVVAQQAA